MPSVLELAGRQLCGKRRSKPALPHALELVGHFLLELVEAGWFDALGFELRTEQDDRIARLPLVELSFRPIRARVATRVAAEAVGQRLDERRSVVASRVRERALRRLPYRPHRHAVDCLGRNLHHLRTRLDLARCHGAECRVLPVAVVLTDEDDR